MILHIAQGDGQIDRVLSLCPLHRCNVGRGGCHSYLIWFVVVVWVEQLFSVDFQSFLEGVEAETLKFRDFSREMRVFICCSAQSRESVLSRGFKCECFDLIGGR